MAHGQVTMANVVQQLYAPHGTYGAAPLAAPRRSGTAYGTQPASHSTKTHGHAHTHGHARSAKPASSGTAHGHGHGHGHGQGTAAAPSHRTSSHKSSSHRSSSRSGRSSDYERKIVEDRRVGKDGHITVVRRYLQTRLLSKGGFARCYKFTGLDRHNHKKVFAGKVVVKASLKKKSAREKVGQVVWARAFLACSCR